MIPAGLLHAINAEPWDHTARLVAADWCGDHGLTLAESQLRHGPPPVGLVLFGDGGGDGYGDGDGDDSGKITLGGRTMPEVGRNQLIVLPHGWVVCGFVAEQTGPYQFRVERASVVVRTGGTPWDELADGKGRESATFRGWGEVQIGPQFVLSREWKGELPEKAK